MIRRFRTRARSAAALALATASACLFAIACSDGGSGSSAPAPAKPAASKPAAAKPATKTVATPGAEAATEATSPADLAKRGRSVYMANCIACHSQDPAQDGALGPAVAGASRELIEARVMRAEYPPGYTPKRESKVMIALPHLGGELDALAAFLAGAK